MKKTILAAVAAFAAGALVVCAIRANQPTGQPAYGGQSAASSNASAQIGEPAVMVKGSSSNCAYEGTLAGNAAKYADVENERSRLRDARSGIPDAMYAANIKAIFENPDISKLNNEDVADLAEKACLNGADLSTYKSAAVSAASDASSPIASPDATPTTYTTSFDCGKAKSDSEHLICENADLAKKDVQLAEVVKQASAHVTDRAAFKEGLRQAWNKRQECHDKDCVSSWYDDQIDALQAGTQPVGDADADAASERATRMMAIAKEMDAAWQIYDTRERRCMTLPVFMGRIGGDVSIKTPEQFAAAYGNDALVHYVLGGAAAEVDASDATFMLAHGTQTCNEISDAQHARGH